MKKILYMDIDGVLAGFDAAIEQIVPGTIVLEEKQRREDVHRICRTIPGFFENLPLMAGAKEATEVLFDLYEVHFLSTPMWDVADSFFEKRLWLENHFGERAMKRLILTHRKDLQMGDFLVDDRKRHGSDRFMGTFIHFGNSPFENWSEVKEFLLKNSKSRWV